MKQMSNQRGGRQGRKKHPVRVTNQKKTQKE